jgi:hypothetical protein
VHLRQPLCHVLPVAFTCSAKYTLLPHLGHCGVVPPHCRAGLGAAPPSAVPYLVPVDVCFSGVDFTTFSGADTDELDRPSVTAVNFVGLLGAPFVLVDGGLAIAFEGLRGTVRGKPVTPRPLLVVEFVNTGLTGRGWSVNSICSSTTSSSSSASKISSDSGAATVSRLFGNTAEVGLKALFGFSIGEGEIVRAALGIVVPVLCVRIGADERRAGESEAANPPGGKGFDLGGDDGRANGIELGD